MTTVQTHIRVLFFWFSCNCRSFLWFLLVTLSFQVVATEKSEIKDERLALVLSGGGARGGAHVGVLKVLEEQGIYPDVIVGTSFGALVGGLYSAGYSATEIESLLLDANLESLFSTLMPRESLSFRRKKDDQDLLVKLKLRFDGNRFILPRGIIPDHRFRLWLGEQFLQKTGGLSFDRLQKEFYSVATNLVQGTEVVLGQGNVDDAIFASMALPGLLEPVTIDENLLSDGGLVNNLPVNVARKLGVTRIIAVDVGTPYRRENELNSSVDVLDQVAKMIVQSNTQQTIIDLDTENILISPDLSHVSTGAFRDLPEAIRAGEQAASLVADKLDHFKRKDTLAEAIATIPPPQQKNRIIHSLNIQSNAALSQNYLHSLLNTEAGQVFDEQVLRKDIERLYSTELFERITYRIDTPYSIEINAKEKKGRKFLQFGLSLEDDFQTNREYNIAVGYTQTQANRHGAEWRTLFQFGEDFSLSSAFYQPFGQRSQYFASVTGLWVRPVVELPDVLSEETSEQRLNGLAGFIEVGRILDNWGQISFRQLKGRLFLDSDFPLDHLDFGYIQANLERDTLNETAFPMRGERLLLTHRWYRQSTGNEFDGRLAALDAVKFYSKGHLY